MKKVKGKFVFLFFIFISVISAEDIKIALIGDSPKTENIADIVTAKLSGSPGFFVYERTEIKKVLDEHRIQKNGFSSKDALQLSKIAHVNIVAYIGSAEAKGGGIPSSLIIFDARSGFRLIDKAMPDGFDKSVAFVIEQIKKSLEGAEKRKYISVLSIRNAGVPEKYNYILANIVTEIERRLLRSPGTAVLERSNLVFVNTERKLSGDVYDLVPSAWLLDFEISPGTSPDKINMCVYILNTSGLELKKIKIEDCMKDPALTLKNLIFILTEYMSLANPSDEPISAKAEASRFFREYKFFARTANYDAAERKLETSVALQPGNPDYRRELALFLMRKAEKYPPKISNEERFSYLLSAGKRALEIMNGIKAQFPEYKKPLYSELPMSAVTNIFINRNNLTAEQKREASEFAEAFRPKHREELMEYYYKFDLSDGINSFKELNDYQKFLFYSTMLGNYLDFHLAAKEKWSTAREFLKYSAEFLNKNPEVLKTLDQEKQFLRFVCFPYDSTLPLKITEEQFKNGGEFIVYAEKHPSPLVRAYGLYIELLRNTILNNYDPGKFSSDMDCMLRKMDRLPLICNAAPSSAEELPMSFFARHKKINEIYHWKQIEYSRKHGIVVSWSFINGYLYNFRNDPDGLAAAAKNAGAEIVFWQNCKDTKKKNEVNGNLAAWASKLNEKNPEHKKAFEILMRGAYLKALCLWNTDKLKLSRTMGGNLILNAWMENGKIYLLLKNSSSFYIYEFDINTCKVSFRAKCENKDFIPLKYSDFDNVPFYASDKLFLLGGENAVLVIPRGGSAGSLIKDLPALQVNALTMLDGRIYVFSGRTGVGDGRRSTMETVLFSCRQNGTDRCVHISTMRREKENFFDKQEPFMVRSVFGDKKRKSIFFAADKPIGGLWEFNPVTKEHKQHIALSKDVSDIRGTKIGTTIYFTGYTRYYYAFDTGTCKSDFILLADTSSHAKYLKEQPRYIQDISVTPPFFVRNEQLWFGGFRINLIETSELSNIKFVNNLQGQSHSTMVFPLPDGISVLAVTRNCIYKLTPPGEDGKKEKNAK